ncbi:nitroreductase family protein [Rosettibacter firmus]|uniref:nitroreductase family protein n=1 Tax=Rosettibacter firmus TaxID=3111522 RepID=UPI00336BE78B
METLEAIFTRRSIRKFKNKEIPEELVIKLLQAAMYAPSARNTQPWHFIVINDRKKLNEIPKLHPYAEMCYEATLAIMICGDLDLEITEGYIALNCAAATQNLLLAAHDLGLGAVWLGVYPRKERMEKLSKFFGIPKNIIPVSLVAIGYPDEVKPKPERFKPDRIHYNHW